MTAGPIEPRVIDVEQVNAEIAEVLVRHGIVSPERPFVATSLLYDLNDAPVGASIRAVGKPAAARQPNVDDAFNAIVEQIREAS